MLASYAGSTTIRVRSVLHMFSTIAAPSKLLGSPLWSACCLSCLVLLHALWHARCFLCILLWVQADPAAAEDQPVFLYHKAYLRTGAAPPPAEPLPMLEVTGELAAYIAPMWVLRR
eukprot:GHRQ01022514.1.p2 GENE.GHRQ01022514.1~~GHRQ01022514.1.p2  ORF type:complete len:116 (-),score=20.90 GHRQ01022514.1:68-415(-)